MDDMRSIANRVKANPDDWEAWLQSAEQVAEPDRKKYCLGQVARIKNRQQGFPDNIQCNNCGTLMAISIETDSAQKKARCPFCHAEIDLESGFRKPARAEEPKTKTANPAPRKETLSAFWLNAFLKFILFAGLLFLIYYLVVGRQFGMPGGLIICFLGALFMMMAIGSFRVAFDKHSTLVLMKKVIKNGSTTTLSDGDKAVFFGKIFPLNGNPIPLPFSRLPGIFFTYGVYQWVWKYSGRRNRREKEYEYNGIHLTPSYLQTEMGKVRLLAYPTLEGFQEHTYSYPGDQKYYQEAARYLSVTEFTDRPRAGLEVIGSAIEQIKEIFSDDDGSIQVDNKSAQEEFDLNTRLLEEKYVLAGEEVCLQGIWSAEKPGVIGDLRKAPAILTKGSPKKVMEVVNHGIIMKVMQGILFAIAINGIIGTIWFVSSVAPRLGIGTVTYTDTHNGKVVTQVTFAPPASEAEQPNGVTAPSLVPGQTAWITYTNRSGHYRYEYPGDWANKEINSQTIDASGQISTPLSAAYKPDVWLMFDVSYRQDGGQCTQREFWASKMAGTPIEVGGVTGKTYESIDPVYGYYLKAIYLPKSDRCLQILIQDKPGFQNKTLFEHMLSSFTFVN